jgi:hypothetical protein
MINAYRLKKKRWMWTLLVFTCQRSNSLTYFPFHTKYEITINVLIAKKQYKYNMVQIKILFNRHLFGKYNKTLNKAFGKNELKDFWYSSPLTKTFNVWIRLFWEKFISIFKLNGIIPKTALKLYNYIIESPLIYDLNYLDFIWIICK